MNLTELMDLYNSDKGSTNHNYTQIYERYLEQYQNDRVCFLEIGVGGEDIPQNGGNSLRGWEDYFPEGKIYGIDIYDKKFVDTYEIGGRIRTFQGSQDDSKFLDSVLDIIGIPDFILDDGSHISLLTIKTFELLWPRLKSGGIYIIEDLECSYRWDFGGFVELQSMEKPTIMNYLFRMTHHLNDIRIADQHYVRPTLYESIEYIHFYPGTVIIKKKD